MFEKIIKASISNVICIFFCPPKWNRKRNLLSHYIASIWHLLLIIKPKPNGKWYPILFKIIKPQKDDYLFYMETWYCVITTITLHEIIKRLIIERENQSLKYQKKSVAYYYSKFGCIRLIAYSDIFQTNVENWYQHLICQKVGYFLRHLKKRIII